MAVSGLAMFGGAKLDELTNRKDGGKNNNSSHKGGDNKNNDAFRKALQNVGRPETDGNNAYERTRTGVAFKKNAANARNINDADSSMRNSAKKRHGMGVMSTKLFSAMVTGMTTSNLYDFDVLKGVGSEFKDVFSDKDFESMGSNYPYSEQYFRDRQKDAVRMMKEAWITAVNNVSKVNLGGSSGSEAVRQARLNASDMIKAPKKVKISNYDRN